MRIFVVLLLSLSATFVQAESEMFTYQVNKTLYEGYYTSPSEDAPLILLFHDWDGLTDYEIKRADMLAERGYTVFAADLFGKDVRPTDDVDKRMHTGQLLKNRKDFRQVLIGAIDAAVYLGANINKAVAIGYCFGGTAVLELARAGAPLRGFVSFHGGLETPEGQDYSETRGKLLVFHGEADTMISMQDFNQLGTELENHGVNHEMISYEGAPHAFTVFGSDRYDENADKASWDRFNAFLQETL